MGRFALHAPMYAGKTALSKALRDQHGYTWVNYTNYLKELAASALNTIDHTHFHSVEGIVEHKAHYRALLQDLGNVIDFNSGDPYIRDMLLREHLLYYAVRGSMVTAEVDDNIVFDCVRTQGQWNILKDLGFTLVRIGITTTTQQRRAAKVGVSAEELARMASHPIETPLRQQEGEITLWYDDNMTPQELADELLSQDMRAGEALPGRTAPLTESAA